MAGRPTRYTDKLGEEICFWIASGKTLKSYCEQKGKPAARTVFGWALDLNHPFSQPYARARVMYAEALVDEIQEIADDSKRDTFYDENGNPRCDHEWVARSRLRIDSRKWLASKICPKLYGVDPLERLANEPRKLNKGAVKELVEDWERATRQRLGLPESASVFD
jgi:hypothetical protein